MGNNQVFPNQVFFKPRQSSRAHNLFFTLLFSLWFFPVNVQAGEVTLGWSPPSAEYGGFILSYGTSSGSYSDDLDVGIETTYTVPNLDAGQTYFFAVKAYGTTYNEESSYSNQVSVTMPVLDTKAPASPKQVQIR